MPDPLLLVDLSDPLIAALTFNRPAQRNALNIELIESITRAIEQAAADLNRRVLIFRGAGPVFCAGLDLKEAAVPENARRSAESLEAMYRAICQSPLVTIAAAQGAAMGGGAGILAACDFVIAAGDLRISYPEVKRGLVAALVTCLLRRQLTDRAVRELILLGQTVEAQRALAMGLVTEVVPGEQLAAAALELARAACKGAPGAITRTKQLLDELSSRPIAEDLRLALSHHLNARQSAEAVEGIAAFTEKREPKWGSRAGD